MKWYAPNRRQLKKLTLTVFSFIHFTPHQHTNKSHTYNTHVVYHRESRRSGRHWRSRLCCRQRLGNFHCTYSLASSCSGTSPSCVRVCLCLCVCVCVCVCVSAALAKDGRYHVRVQTRNPQHRAAQELAQLPNVSFHVGHIESDDLMREAMQGMDGVFFLANGFAIGDKAEIFWSMRAFEIARETGVKFFQFSSIDYYLKKGGYDPKFRCAHADAKGRVASTRSFTHSLSLPSSRLVLYHDLTLNVQTGSNSSLPVR